MICSACRVDIPFGGRHYVCSVSTCNRSRTALVFCSVPCWDTHVVVLRHRDAWAVEAQAPTREAAASAQQRTAEAPATRVAPPAPAEADVLIVVSKVKKYIKDRSGMNTSDSVATALSDHIRALCDAAIRAAATEGRKTVLDRDVPRV